MTPSFTSRNAWNIRRIIFALLVGTMIAGYDKAFDFWQTDPADRLRDFCDLAILLIFPAVILTMFVWLISALIALFSRNVRGAFSSIIAIVIIPVWVKSLLAMPLVDPWYWYITFNRVDFEKQAAVHISSNEVGYIVLEERDITTGLAGVSQNTFVKLIYSDADPEILTATLTGARHIQGKFYKIYTVM